MVSDNIQKGSRTASWEPWYCIVPSRPCYGSRRTLESGNPEITGLYRRQLQPPSNT